MPRHVDERGGRRDGDTPSNHASSWVTSFSLFQFELHQRDFNITAVTPLSFSYTPVPVRLNQRNWVRTGSTTPHAGRCPASLCDRAVEYCSDPVSRTACRSFRATRPRRIYTPAYVRFCQTQARLCAGRRRRRQRHAALPQQVQRDSWHHAICVCALWLVQAHTIKSSVISYGNRSNRADCAAAPNCTYDEELNNYARWYTYYRLRIKR